MIEIEKDQQFIDMSGSEQLGLSVFQFTAPWCGPCKAITPVMHELSDSYGDEVTIAKIDSDKLPNIAAKNAIRAIPALLFFKDGKEVDRIVGMVPKNQIVETIEKYK